MPRRRQRLSQFRCLAPLLYGMPALIVLWAAQSMFNVVCRPAVPACTQLPEMLVDGCFVWLGACLAYSAYRYYRDFVKGDYYVDLAEAGYL
ncbi:hypothetical protein RFUL19S_04362 [Rhizobacter fulvus]